MKDTTMLVTVSKDDFNSFLDVRNSGDYNMYDPNARAMTGLTKQEWIHIMKNYSELKTKHEGEQDDNK